MDRERLSDAICKLDDELIESTDIRRSEKKAVKFPPTHIFTTAACLVLALGIFAAVSYRVSLVSPDGGVTACDGASTLHLPAGDDEELRDGTDNTEGEEGCSVTTPPIVVEAGGFEHYEESIGYFAYDGRLYFQTQLINDYDGCEHIGTVSNIFLYDPPYNYHADFAANFDGDIINSESFPEEYLLYAVIQGNAVVFTCMHGVTYESAADLFDYRLSLKENFDRFAYTLEETGITNILELDSESNKVVFDAFIDSLYQSKLISDLSQLKLSREETYIGELLCKTSMGYEIAIGLHRGGYVSTHGIVVKVDEDIFNAFTALLTPHEFDYTAFASYVANSDNICTAACHIAGDNDIYLYFCTSKSRPLDIELNCIISSVRAGGIKPLDIPDAGLRGMETDSAQVIYARSPVADGFSCEFIVKQSNSETGDAQYLLYSNEQNADFYRWVEFSFIKTLTETELAELRRLYPENFHD